MDEPTGRLRDYLCLAELSAQRKQTAGRDRFLILAAINAAESGWLRLADRCLQIVLMSQPHHLLQRYGSMADALRDPDFLPFRRTLERFCSREQAEHLLSINGIIPRVGDAIEPWANSLLDSWSRTAGDELGPGRSAE